NQAFDGGGPFSITRAGTLPMGQLVRLCFSGQYSQQEVLEMLNSKADTLPTWEPTPFRKLIK
ncbi:MAG TPA: butyrate kinase, partial [Bacteroidales bacterium]|nr:butyrate kinase [Bacteroidales bacterium]